MIIPDKKKAVTVILSRMKKDGKESMGSLKDEAPIGDVPFKDIAEQLLLAVENKSASDLAMALEAFADQLKLEDQEQESED